MARLTIGNVAAPDFRSTGQLLNNANTALNAGLDGASQVLDQYNQGQQEIADNSILTDIAKLKSEEDLQAFLGSEATQGKNFSPAMKQQLLTLRKGILANEKSRADIGFKQAETGRSNASAGFARANSRSVDARTSIARAGESRKALEFTDQQRALEEQRRLAPLALASAEEQRRVGPVSQEAVRNGTAPPRPATQRYLAALANAGTLTPGTIQPLAAIPRTAASQGQAAFDAERTRLDKETAARALLEGANASTSGGGVQQYVAQQNFRSPTAKLNAVIGAPAVAGKLGAIVKPPNTDRLNPEVSAAVSLSNKAANRAIQALPQTRLVELNKKFDTDKSKDPIQALISHLSIGKDGQNPNTWGLGLFGANPDINGIRKHINEVAQRAGISVSMAAAISADVFERDPLGTNTPQNRFPMEAVLERANTYVSPDAMRRYDETIARTSVAQEKTNRNIEELKSLKVRAAKAGKNVDPKITARIKQLQKGLLNSQLDTKNRTPSNLFKGNLPKPPGMSALEYSKKAKLTEAIKATRINSSERSALVRDIIGQITNNPSLSARDKADLITFTMRNQTFAE